MPETAKVDVVISAVTEAAEQALEDVSDRMTDLAQSAQPAQSATDEAADELDDAASSAFAAGRAFESVDSKAAKLGATMQLLQGRADEAADELDDARNSAATAVPAFSTLSLSTDGLALSFSGLSATTLGVLIPALAALAATLVPIAATIAGVAAAAAGLAGAFGAVIGSGILAFGEKLATQNQERLDQINQEISAIQELKAERAGLTEEQASELQQARETVDALQAKREATTTLTDAQQARLDQLQATRDGLLEQARTEDGLTATQQARLDQTRQQIDQLEGLRNRTSALTNSEQRRLESAKQTIDQLEAQKDAEGSLSQAEQERLNTLKSKRDALQEQTSASGALSARLGELKEEIAPLIVQFGQAFVPLIEDAVNALPTLVENVLDAMGGMGAFREALRDFGGAAMEAIPQVVAALMDLARQALPAVRELGAWLLDNGGDIFDGIMETTEQMGPVLMDLVSGFIDALPAINDFGMVLINDIAPALGDLARQAGELVGRIDLARLFDDIGRAAGVVGDAIADIDFGEIMSGFSALDPKAIVAAFVSIAQAIEANEALIRDVIAGFSRLANGIAAGITVLGQLAKAFGNLPLVAQKALILGVVAAVVALGGPISLVTGLVIGLVLVFDDLMEIGADVVEWLDGAMTKAVNGAKDVWQGLMNFLKEDLTLENLVSVVDDALTAALTQIFLWGNRLKNTFIGIWNGVVDVTKMALDGLLQLVTDQINGVLETANRGIRKVNKRLPDDKKIDTFGTFDAPTLPETEFTAERNRISREEARQRAEDAVKVAVEFNGSGKFGEAVQEETDVRIDRRERERTRRNLRRNATR